MKNFTLILAALFTLTANAAPVGAAYQVYRMGSSGTIPAFGAIDLSQSAAVTGVLKPANGGYIGQNLVINGMFDFWQRGSSLSSGTGSRYLADRWRNTSVGSTNTVSRGVFTVGQTDVPGEPRYYHSMTVSTVAGASNYAGFQHFVEDVRTCAGQVCTLQFWAKADGNKNISIFPQQGFGTGGSPSSGVSLTPQMVSLTTQWQKFNLTFNVPSISGKTFGTTNYTSYLSFFFWIDCGSSLASQCNSIGQQSGTFDLANVSLVKGYNGPDSFVRAGGDLAGELSKVQRYYEKSYEIETDPASSTTEGLEYSACRYASATTIDHCSRITFKVPKRIASTALGCSLWNDSGTANQWKNQGNTSLATSIDTKNIRGFNITSTADSGKTIEQGAGWYGHWACDADF